MAKSKASKGSTRSSGKRSSGKRAAAGRSRGNRAQDAIQLLKNDHREVEKHLSAFEKASGSRKAELARTICQALTVHAQLEEEIFYPAAREQIDDQELLDEAEVEHASAKQLIGEIESGSAGDPLFDAKVKVLGEYVKHHVKEEEREMFPQARKAGIDLKGLGEQIRMRKMELMPRGGRS
jgi:hemerythrin superfamily protein